jgi:hypothetical protein
VLILVALALPLTVLVVGTFALLTIDGDGQSAAGGRDEFCADVAGLADDPAADPMTGDVDGLLARRAELAGRMDAIDPPAEIADDWAMAIASLRGTASDEAAGSRVLTYVEERCGPSNFLMGGL